jgi:nucleoside-diphosphate-sugar epimerase
MGYVLNLTDFLITILKFPLGKFVYNFADKPDLNMNELIEIFYNTLGRNYKNNLKIPYSIGLIGGYVYDILSKIAGNTYTISSIRIKKFCANTVINADKLQQTGFTPSYTLVEGLSRMIKSEFVTAQNQDSSVQVLGLNKGDD